MATEPKQPMSEDQDPTERKSQEAESEQQRSNKASDAKEGMPGYGQPDEQVREKKLPEQKW